jgi:DNA-binding response OmpR family regulator
MLSVDPALKQEKRVVLLAEDDLQMRSMLASALEREGFEVVAVENGVQLLDEVRATRERETEPHLIVSDIHMPECSGLMALTTLRRMNFQMPVLLITAFGDEDTHAQARSLGATLLDKPFDLYRFRALAAGIAAR